MDRHLLFYLALKLTCIALYVYFFDKLHSGFIFPAIFGRSFSYFPQYQFVDCATVMSYAGLAFPPLYFYNGGLKEFLATIKQHAFLVR